MSRGAPVVVGRGALLVALATGCASQSPGASPAAAVDAGSDAAPMCTGVAAGDSGSGVPRDCTVVSLSPQQGAQLCDWINQAQGGYGRTMQCAFGPVATDPNQAHCVSGLPDLQVLCPTLTVAQVEDCTLAQGPDLCRYLTDVACAPLRACACVP
jgi:hypothetical protein